MPGYLALLLATACHAPHDSTADTFRFDDSPVIDGDRDGIAADNGDRDDNDAAVGPGEAELCDGIDQDCDGLIDEGTPDAARDGVAEVGPDVVLAVIDATDTCGPLAVYATVAADPDLPVDVTWTFRRPDGSLVPTDAISITGDRASVWPDVDGTWHVAATARDAGNAAGRSDAVDVAINVRAPSQIPIADAGASQTRAATVACANGMCPPCDPWDASLDGTGSTDADGERLAYRWAVTSGQAVIHDAIAGRPSITVPGAVPSLGQTATETVFFQLIVTDGSGLASVADTVAVTSSCTGSSP